MTTTTVDQPVITTADGVPLQVALRRTTRLNRIRAFALVTPLLLFILITFVVPIADMVFRSVNNPTIGALLPNTAAALEAWDGQEIPGEAAFAALANEMKARSRDRQLGLVGNRLNYELSGARTLINKTARKIAKVEQGPYRDAFLNTDRRWGETNIWALIKRLAAPYTVGYYLAALDLTFDADGRVVAQPDYRRIYVTLFARTLWVSLLITMLCLVLGYPISYLMATVPVRISNLLIIMVLLPFWTSLLVRTTSWIVLLQTQGVINDIFAWSGIIGEDNRVQMIYNMPGTIIAMTHVLLPFMVLPLFSVMKTISPSHMRAAQSLGASPPRAFVRVYFPQTIPGIGAGSLLVFILSVGYYITPALVGGRTGQLISNFIAYHIQHSLNWGLGAALGTILLIGVLALYWLFNHLVGIDKLRLG